jgi:succinate dehydrogenase flavin-adding protein (antitoxin of CptAB toxin-antitoxin module)
VTLEARTVERLRWQSRRGLLELDIVLARFWARNGPRLEDEEAAALARLLAMTDNDLLDCVMGRAEAPEARLAPMVEKLRAV